MITQKNKLLFCLAAIAISQLPGSASAMTAREGFIACDKNPKCRADTQKNGDVIFTDGSFVVYCPQQGKCDLIAGRTGGTKPKILRDALKSDIAAKAN